jgi:putative ABC transport system permease protein
MIGRRSQRDFQDEIEAHIDLETERLKALGLSDEDAALAARRRFGNVGIAQDQFYHGRRFVTIDDTFRDMRHALRGLLRTPTFLATTTITLALAIGAVAGMFDVVNSVLLRPLPYRDSERLVTIAGTAPGSDLPEQFGLGAEFYLHYKENSKLLDGIAAVPGGTSTLRVGDRVERVPMSWPWGASRAMRMATTSS